MKVHSLVVPMLGLVGATLLTAAGVAETTEIVLQISHPNIESADITQDGKLLATGGGDGDVVIWEIETSRRLRLLRGHKKPIGTVTFSPDRRRLLSIAQESIGRERSVLLTHHPAVVWDVVTGEVLQTIDPGPDGFTAAAFHPDGNHVLAGEPSGRVRLWNVNSGKAIRSFEAHSEAEISSVCIGNDGRYAVSASYDGKAIWWDLESGKALNTYDCYTCAAIDANAETVLTDTPNIAVVRNADMGNKLQQIVTDGSILQLALSPNGKQVILEEMLSGVRPPFRAKVYAVESGKLRGEIRTGWGIEMIKFVNGRPLVLTGDSKLMDVESAKTVCDLGIMKACGSFPVTFSPDSTQFVTANFFWDVSSGIARHPLPHRIRPLAISPDNKFLLGCGAQAGLWKISTGKCVHRYSGHKKAVSCGDFSPDGKLALSGSWDGTVRIWERATGALRTVLSEQERETSIARGVRLGRIRVDYEYERLEKPEVEFCRFSHDSKRVITGSNEAITIWDVSGKKIKSLEINHDVSMLAPNVAGVAFRDDGQQVLAGYHNGTIYIWSAKTYEHVATLKATGWRLFFVDFLPGGKQIITGCWDGTATVWDLTTKIPVRTIKQVSLSSMSISADGQRLLTGSSKGPATMWNLKAGERLVDFYSFNWGKEWLAITPHGYYDGSPAARKIVMRRKRKALLELEACPDLHRPDFVAAALRQAK